MLLAQPGQEALETETVAAVGRRTVPVPLLADVLGEESQDMALGGG
jgi:hypothetical protein